MVPWKTVAAEFGALREEVLRQRTAAVVNCLD